MPCDEIIIRKSPSAKTRLEKPRFLRENRASPRRAFFDSEKTSKNTPIDIVEKTRLIEKRRENAIWHFEVKTNRGGKGKVKMRKKTGIMRHPG
jgi:hypothetical protein